MRNIGAHILFTVVANFFFFQSTIQAALQVDSDPLVYHMEGRHGGEANIAHGKPVMLGLGTVFDGENPQHSPFSNMNALTPKPTKEDGSRLASRNAFKSPSRFRTCFFKLSILFYV